VHHPLINGLQDDDRMREMVFGGHGGPCFCKHFVVRPAG